jgi:hypothetical protein
LARGVIALGSLLLFFLTAGRSWTKFWTSFAIFTRLQALASPGG